MPQAKIWYSVQCNRHGIQNTGRHDAAPFVVVGVPKNEKARKFGHGCPVCYKEKLREEEKKKK